MCAGENAEAYIIYLANVFPSLLMEISHKEITSVTAIQLWKYIICVNLDTKKSWRFGLITGKIIE